MCRNCLILKYYYYSSIRKNKNKVVLKIQKQTISRKIWNSFVREETGTLCWDQKVHQFRPPSWLLPLVLNTGYRGLIIGKNSAQFSQRIKNIYPLHRLSYFKLHSVLKILFLIWFFCGKQSGWSKLCTISPNFRALWEMRNFPLHLMAR